MEPATQRRDSAERLRAKRKETRGQKEVGINLTSHKGKRAERDAMPKGRKGPEGKSTKSVQRSPDIGRGQNSRLSGKNRRQSIQG